MTIKIILPRSKSLTSKEYAALAIAALKVKDPGYVKGKKSFFTTCVKTRTGFSLSEF